MSKKIEDFCRGNTIISKLLLQKVIDTIKEKNEKNGDQFVYVEDSFYPQCVACGRTNIEHNMGKKINCPYENNIELIEKLESVLNGSEEICS